MNAKDILEQINALSNGGKFQLVGVPALLFLIGLIFNILSKGPELREGGEMRRKAFREVFGMGQALCLIGMGVMWSLLYYNSMVLAVPTFVLMQAIQFILLAACAAFRVLLIGRPGLEIVVTNLVGVLSLSFSYALITAVGI